jgi:hypothetical protein
MFKMTGIVLMGFGVMAFVSGLVLYQQKPQEPLVEDYQKQMNHAVELASADGVLT